MSDRQGCGGNCEGCGCSTNSTEVPAVLDTTAVVALVGNEINAPLTALFDNAIEAVEDASGEEFVDEEAGAMNAFFMMGALSTIRLLRDGAILVSSHEKGEGPEATQMAVGFSMRELEDEAMAELGRSEDEAESEEIAPATRNILSSILSKKG